MPKSRRRAPALKKPSKITRKNTISKAQQRLEKIRMVGTAKVTSLLDAIIDFENGLVSDLERTSKGVVHLYESKIRGIKIKASKKKITRASKAFTTAITPHSPKIGIILLFLGGSLLVFPTAYKHYQKIVLPKVSIPKIDFSIKKQIAPTVIAKDEPIKIDAKLLSTTELSQSPQRIMVPSMSLDLPIVEAKVVNGLWETSQTSASHGIGSANPGEIGNTVIFAHARDDLFGPLRNLKRDTIIYVLTKDHWYKYRAEDIKLVNPNEVQVIAPTPDATLTLYTCSGFLDSKRLIISAKPT